ncbi:hypothetical protein DFH08DRAFT_950416 [Mycena albidolilacea]|uniref:Uncharacterized protein n=1 Tax=Mycena albidolilacea TaxID=1033008 RepID=A0AAD7AQ85_9AGAR|nr:hypothetical protein DFH08DRAFT_950416 [Mycena albidolilacea]
MSLLGVDKSGLTDCTEILPQSVDLKDFSVSSSNSGKQLTDPVIDPAKLEAEHGGAYGTRISTPLFNTTNNTGSEQQQQQQMDAQERTTSPDSEDYEDEVVQPMPTSPPSLDHRYRADGQPQHVEHGRRRRTRGAGSAA